MAQSAMARFPLGANFYWDIGHQPELDWDKWLSTVKLAIMVKDNIQVEKLLQQKTRKRGPRLSSSTTL